MTKIALDAMGGDHGPEPLVAGALDAAQADLRVVLVGDATRLDPLVSGPGSAFVEIVHTPDFIPMDSEPALAVRALPQASVRVLMRMVADGSVNAGVSAGSTGATLTSALLDLGRLPGVRRPAIAGALPVRGYSGRDVLLVDAGGSPDVQPAALVDWARLGRAYARARGVSTPVVGLLNVGTEVGKGNELTRAAHELLMEWSGGAGTTGPIFHGNVEPAHVLSGAVDVVVTDGFTGNILIKGMEAAFAERMDLPPGALVIGVRGTVVVAHGAAGGAEIGAAISTAVQVTRNGWLEDVRSGI